MNSFLRSHYFFNFKAANLLILILLLPINAYSNDNPRDFLEKNIVSAISGQNKEHRQLLNFNNKCELKITRNYPNNRNLIMTIPLNLMDADRTRTVFTEFYNDIYWKAKSFSVEIKALNSKKEIKTIDNKGNALYYSDYVWVYSKKSTKENAEKIRNALRKVISDCS